MTQSRKSLFVNVTEPSSGYYSLLKTFSYSEIYATLDGPNFDHYFLIETFLFLLFGFLALHCQKQFRVIADRLDIGYWQL